MRQVGTRRPRTPPPEDKGGPSGSTTCENLRVRPLLTPDPYHRDWTPPRREFRIQINPLQSQDRRRGDPSERAGDGDSPTGRSAAQIGQWAEMETLTDPARADRGDGVRRGVGGRARGVGAPTHPP